MDRRVKDVHKKCLICDKVGVLKGDRGGRMSEGTQAEACGCNKLRGVGLPEYRLEGKGT